MPDKLPHDADTADRPTRQVKPSGRPPATSIPSAATLEFATRLASEGQRKYLERDYDDAQQLLQKSLEIRERAPNAGTSGLIDSLTGLAAVYVARGDLDRAEPLLERALAGSEQLLGPSHSGLSPLLNNLAHVYYKRKKYEPAERLLTRLAGIKSADKKDEAELAGVLASLATVREASGHIAAARLLWLRVLSIRESTLGADSPAVAGALEHLGELSAAAGHLEQALSLRGRALAIRERSLSPGDASLRVARDKIASLRAAVDARITRAQKPPERQRASFSDIDVTATPRQLADRAPPATPTSVPVDAIFQAIAAAGSAKDGIAARISGRVRTFFSGRSPKSPQPHPTAAPGGIRPMSSLPPRSTPLSRPKPIVEKTALDEVGDEFGEEALGDEDVLEDEYDGLPPSSKFDPFSDRAWPKTKLIGGIVCLVALLAVAVSLIASTDDSAGDRKAVPQSVSADPFVAERTIEDKALPVPVRAEPNGNPIPAASRRAIRETTAKRRQQALDSLARERTASLARPMSRRTSQSRVPRVRAIVPQ